jgi:hypothetical protein
MLKLSDTHIFVAVGTTPLLIASSLTSKVQEIMVMRRRITGNIADPKGRLNIDKFSCGLGASGGALNGPRLPAPVQSFVGQVGDWYAYITRIYIARCSRFRSPCSSSQRGNTCNSQRDLGYQAIHWKELPSGYGFSRRRQCANRGLFFLWGQFAQDEGAVGP